MDLFLFVHLRSSRKRKTVRKKLEMTINFEVIMAAFMSNTRSKNKTKQNKIIKCHKVCSLFI